MTVTFQDGEPVDPKKLQDLQIQIDELKKQSAETYNLTQTTAGKLASISFFYAKGGVVEFPEGLKAGKNTIAIPLDWAPGIKAAYVVATPRLQDPKVNNIRWSISGGQTSTLLNVYSEKAISAKINFHWISVGEKDLTAG